MDRYNLKKHFLTGENLGELEKSEDGYLIMYMDHLMGCDRSEAIKELQHKLDLMEEIVKDQKRTIELFAEDARKVPELKSHIERLTELAKPFADCACSEIGQCECHNCLLRDALNETEKQSLTLHDCEVIEKMLSEIEHGLISLGFENILNISTQTILEYAEQLKESQ